MKVGSKPKTPKKIKTGGCFLVNNGRKEWWTSRNWLFRAVRGDDGGERLGAGVGLLFADHRWCDEKRSGEEGRGVRRSFPAGGFWFGGDDCGWWSEDEGEKRGKRLQQLVVCFRWIVVASAFARKGRRGVDGCYRGRMGNEKTD
ncbi:hypothetical protein HAX54_013703 [Datura stramonium]|uniref:Uncharacterized protein n=1 Tax=Datura stramonium TaxID=4076 RepID=A0ABS8RYM7_DATST|nr:hypothetical protein [Datura stramonium]